MSNGITALKFGMIGLVPLSFWQILATLDGLPIFDADARVSSVDGGWTVPDTTAHYDRAAYLFHIGHGYVSDLGASYDPDTGDLVFLDADQLLDQTRIGEAHLRDGLALDPANSHIWASLAQAQVKLGQPDQARERLATSWALAPHNTRLASMRMGLAAQLAERGVSFSPAERAALIADMNVMEQADPGIIAVISDVSDGFVQLVRLLRKT